MDSNETKRISKELRLTSPQLVDKETGLSLIISKGATNVSSELQSNIDEQKVDLLSHGAPLSASDPPTGDEFQCNKRSGKRQKDKKWQEVVSQDAAATLTQ